MDLAPKPMTRKPEDIGKPETVGKPEVVGKPATVGKPDLLGKPADAGKPETTGKPALTGLANAASRVTNPTAQAAIARNIARKSARVAKGTQPKHFVSDHTNHTRPVLGTKPLDAD